MKTAIATSSKAFLVPEDRIKSLPSGWEFAGEISNGLTYVNEEEEIEIHAENLGRGITVSAILLTDYSTINQSSFPDSESANRYALTLMNKYTGALNLYGRPRFKKGEEVVNERGNKESIYDLVWDYSQDKYLYYLSKEDKQYDVYYDEERLTNYQRGIFPSAKVHGKIRSKVTEEPSSEIKATEAILPIFENKEENRNWLIHDNFYKLHPGKILGTPFQASGRFGMVTKYKGTLDILNQIDTSGIKLPDHTINPSLTVIEDEVTSINAVSDKTIHDNIVKAIEASEKAIANKVISRLEEREENDEPAIYELLSFDEVFRQYNPDISEEELKAFIWYKNEIGQPLSSYWNNFKYNQETYTTRSIVTKQVLDEWVQNQILCYYKGSLIPSYLFFAENLWERLSTLESDKKDIIELYGEEVYNKQFNRLNALFKDTVYKRRLLIDNTDESKKLIILPNSDFAHHFTIETLSDESPFLMKAMKRKEGYGEPDFLNDHKLFKEDKKRKLFTSLNLNQAFQYWIVKNSTSIEFKKGSSYSEIINLYIHQKQMPPVPDGKDKEKARAEWERKKARAKEEGDRLFGVFLETQLPPEDKYRIEVEWNTKFNGYQRIDFNKVPIAFQVARTYRNEPMEIRAEKREGVAFLFSEGSGCIAYDVGFGKTWTSIFTIAQFLDSGYCKRPLIVVPNQTYKQWLSEIKGILPHIPVNDLYNLSKDYMDELAGPEGSIQSVPEGTISVMTYEGFERIGFNETTETELLTELYEILNQGGESEKSERKKASFKERLETIIGRGLKGTMLQIEDLGFDFLCVDEAHAMKKIFTAVKGEAEEGSNKRSRVQYKINSGSPSSIGLKGFMIAQYILRSNFHRNIVLLTATPFTNSPLEVFSMLALIAYKKLQESEINNLTNFFDNYIQVNTELIINSKLRPERKQIVTGFNNIPALQTLIFRFINFKNADTRDVRGNKVKIVRPDKYVLPLKKKLINGEVIPLPEEEQVNTIIPLSPLQQDFMNTIKQYVEGKVGYQEICALTSTGALEMEEEVLGEEDIKDMTEGIELNEEDLSELEKNGVRLLKGMSLARNLALSPYLLKCKVLDKPGYKEYIESSPKLHFVMLCIQSVKEYHESRQQPVSGQVIYMDRGVEYFPLIAEYLVKEIGYKEHEVAIIKSQMKGGKTAKETIKNRFLGMEYDEKTRTFRNIADGERVKVIIGSSTIKEGINLQKKSTVLYDCFLDWNPTDLVQLEGRIWRQGNEFGSVRIVYPLMENSMDIFMFQKLEEKTQRINQIWDIDNESSVLKLEEFNPEELKYELISDPLVIAELELKDLTEKLNDSMASISHEISRIDEINHYNNYLTQNIENLRTEVKQHRKLENIDNASVRTLIEKVNEIFRSQLNIEGIDFKEADKYKTRSPYKKIGYFKPYWFDDFGRAYKIVQKETQDYLIPKNLTLETLDAYKESLNKEIKRIEKKIKESSSEESIQVRAQEIHEERIKNQYERKSMEERVEEFKRLNYLLEHKQVKEISKELPAISCPPMDENGNRRVDKEAISILENCISYLPQTKALNTISPDEYTEERKKLHQMIIEGILKGKECVDKDKTEPICLLTGGLPGSGKSTFLKKYSQWLTSEKVFRIDADEIRSKLPEYKGWNASITHLETKDIVNNLLDSIGDPCEFDMVYDGTMNKARNYIPLIEKIKKLGYKIFVAYLQVPYALSRERVLERYRRTGRYVPIEVINDAYEKGLEAFNTIKGMVNGYVLVDGITQEILEQGGEEIPQDRGYKINVIPLPVNREQLLKEKEAKAQEQRLRLLKKKLELRKAA